MHKMLWMKTSSELFTPAGVILYIHSNIDLINTQNFKEN